MNRKTTLACAIAGLGIFCWAFPPVHIHSLKNIRAEQASRVFNPSDFVAEFWQDQLLPATENAVDASELMGAIVANRKQAHEQYGRSVGIGDSYFYFLRGSGRVVSVSDDDIGISLKGEGDTVDISIPLGFIFGNALRDGTGLLSASDYPESQQFNDISACLNQIAETEVLPELQRLVKVGMRIEFAGCVEVSDEDFDLEPLTLVPVFVKAK